MIIYDPQAYRGLEALCLCCVKGRKYGCKTCLRASPFVYAAPYALLSMTLALLIKLGDNPRDGSEAGGFSLFAKLAPGIERNDAFFDHPYSLHIWGMVVGFTVVFRGNMAYQRFAEGRRELARMSSYWMDFAMNAICFDEINKDVGDYYEWKAELGHLISLLHAVALQNLRLDSDTRNLVRFNKAAGEGIKASAEEAATTFGRDVGSHLQAEVDGRGSPTQLKVASTAAEPEPEARDKRLELRPGQYIDLGLGDSPRASADEPSATVWLNVAQDG